MYKLILGLAISSALLTSSSFAASFNSVISDFDRLIKVDQPSGSVADSNNRITLYSDNTQKAAMVKCTEIQRSNYSQYSEYTFIGGGNTHLNLM